MTSVDFSLENCLASLDRQLFGMHPRNVCATSSRGWDRLEMGRRSRTGHAWDGDTLESCAHGGITSRSLTHQLGTRTHDGIHRGALRGESPRTREGRNGPTVQKY